MIQIVGLFLIGMLVLAIAGRMRSGRDGRQVTGRCKACGRHRIGRGSCPCGNSEK